MTHYNESSSSVRVDYFKPGGKWYMTEAVEMHGQYEMTSIHEAVSTALSLHWNETRGLDRMYGWKQFTIVVLEPYHIHAHPVMIRAENTL